MHPYFPDFLPFFLFFTLCYSMDTPALIPSLESYDPSGVGVHNGNLFGFPFTAATAQVWILPVPWDVTTSYRPGTAQGPAAILQESTQLDFFDPVDPEGWKRGIFMAAIDEFWWAKNKTLRSQADGIIEQLEAGKTLGESPDLQQDLNLINQTCQALNQWVYDQCQTALDQGRTVGILGGDHSVPLGYLQALADRATRDGEEFGILHIDAHADLRRSYEGFTFSHASIMDNALKLAPISRLVQVGIRDLCPDEAATIANSQGRIVTYLDRTVKSRLFQGESWGQLCQEIIAALPQRVYISFDIDGLDPTLCPATGTPVPGGLGWGEALFLLEALGQSDRQIVGFDLCEVGPQVWDANVGARLLYQLALLASR